MAKVIQVRGVPDDVHAALVEAAEKAGKSLTSYLSDVLVDLTRRVDPYEHNRRVIEELRAEIGVIDIPRGETRRAIHEGREERDRSLGELGDTRHRGA